MALLQIRTFPDPVLKQKAQEVTVFDDSLKQLLKNMLETMYHSQGIGLAANQVGSLKRVLVADVSRESNNPLELVNPKIVWRQGETCTEEGCLSIPDYREKVKRSAEILVQAQDSSGAPIELKAEGLLAVCIQHEIDHLDGILFVDRVSRLKRQLFTRWFRKNKPEEREIA